jgi:hypothetical protein
MIVCKEVNRPRLDMNLVGYIKNLHVKTSYRKCKPHTKLKEMFSIYMKYWLSS